MVDVIVLMKGEEEILLVVFSKFLHDKKTSKRSLEKVSSQLTVLN